MEFIKAPEINKEINKIIKKLQFVHVNPRRLICFRSTGSTSRAIARIWNFPRVWQLALNLPSYYVIEVISERFDKLNKPEQHKVLIHELLHIPRNFSGSLLPHRTRSQRIDHRRVEALYQKLIGN
ncbi:hypothetical protein A2W14_07525 [Candidatus Gottesmanbacteria bacterium RBG_16_37_8]|uniref:Putative phage metallopeptidase domain-containing protein n=1 Tax=Candidatus Gottesmanbacteria bacterium RBG_16_37_8 TaxID=1798371 RepID=A0A1F5YT54_9BACT|nr:MAG: hypothetical protein A2W14_07525 [Candidatus Gottesmanbacteria bacterium RBG_16_37_8]